MGALLQSRTSGDVIPEELNLSRPDVIRQIHEDYAAAGADFITTNTFGATYLKLKEISLADRIEEVNNNAVRIAREVADRHGIWVAGNIGSSGKLLAPLGDLGFQEAVENFSRQARLLEEGGSDFLLLETMIDIQEFRAAVVGILSVVQIPLVVSMSFTHDDLSVSGTDGATFGVTSDFCGVVAAGSNCGSSLESMKRVMEGIAETSPLPLLCQPNAGLPVKENGKTVFNVGAVEFGEFMEDMYRLGVSILGSCCGSTPEFTSELARRFKKKEPVPRKIDSSLRVSSRSAFKKIDHSKVFLAGERINPTGRKKLREELASGKLNILKSDARDQTRYGSDILDVNINLHKLNLDVAEGVIQGLQNLVQIPLMIDSMDIQLIERFCQLYAGRGIINSISGESGSLKNLIPIAKKYNMAFVAALFDDGGIPETSGDRLKIARRIAREAEKAGIPLTHAVFDPLVLSAGAEIEKVRVTLETIELLREEFPENNTIVGLSNVSFGLPRREQVNNAFMAMAVSRGLNMVIANPLQESFRDQLLTLNFLKSGSRNHLAKYTDHFSKMKKINTEKSGDDVQSDTLHDNIIEGDVNGARKNIVIELEKHSPFDVINGHIIKAMNEVGRRYQKKEYFLPQLIASADVVKSVLPFIQEKIPKQDSENQTRILFATVKGDIHDIGKNIVVSILESFNHKVIDLGKDVPAEAVITGALENDVHVIALSTLMTTTLDSMFDTVRAIQNNPKLSGTRIFIGGAVVNRKMADEVSVSFARDGMDMVKILQGRL